MENQDEIDRELLLAPKESSTDKFAWKSIGKSLISGILVALLIVLAKACAEQANLFQGFEKAAYEWLQTRLSAPHRRDELPVMIVDIRELEYKTIEVEGEKYSLTSREKLIPLIEAVAAEKPKVIAVDIDFSPHKIGSLDPRDPIYFQNLAKLNVRVFLGIFRSRTRPRELWLGNPQFASLAANVANPDDNRRMFEWTSGADGQTELTMCKALANAFPEEKKLNSYFSRAVRQVSETQTEDGRKAGEFLVDFSPLEALKDTRLKTIDPAVIKDQGWTLFDKAVLIGDGSLYDARDSVIIPVQGQTKPVPGVYLHAAAAYTLIKSPIYEFTGLARFLLDIVLALVVLIGVLIVRIRLRKSRLSFAQTRATYLFIVIVTIVVIILGVVFVHKTRVLWGDFAFVILGLWFHPPVESLLSPTKKLLKAIWKAFGAFLVDQQ
jgi:hypothetical protein